MSGCLEAAVEALEAAFAGLSAEPAAAHGSNAGVEAAVALLLLGRGRLLVLHLLLGRGIALGRVALWGVPSIRWGIALRRVPLGRGLGVVATLLRRISRHVLVAVATVKFTGISLLTLQKESTDERAVDDLFDSRRHAAGTGRWIH